MESGRIKQTLNWMDRFEAPLCLLINRSVANQFVATFFGKISRLGDGVFWYVMMLALPVFYGLPGLMLSLQMIFVGALGLLIYRRIKAITSRPRPFMVHGNIRKGVVPLDKFSFPSGHTLHAVSFSCLMIAFDANLIWLVLPFAALVALSRVVLGLHYPSDVLIGGLAGMALSVLTMYIFS